MFPKVIILKRFEKFSKAFSIDGSNIPGLLMVIGFSSIQLLTLNFVHDLSRESDLKESPLLK